MLESTLRESWRKCSAYCRWRFCSCWRTLYIYSHLRRFNNVSHCRASLRLRRNSSYTYLVLFLTFVAAGTRITTLSCRCCTQKSTIIYSRVAALCMLQRVSGLSPLCCQSFGLLLALRQSRFHRLIGALFALLLGPNLAVSAANSWFFAVASPCCKTALKNWERSLA